MSFIENTVAGWAELQRLQAAPAGHYQRQRRVLALLREAFTRIRPRVALDDFHAMTDSFLTRLQMDGVPPRADGKFVYDSPNPPPDSLPAWTATPAAKRP